MKQLLTDHVEITQKISVIRSKQNYCFTGIVLLIENLQNLSHLFVDDPDQADIMSANFGFGGFRKYGKIHLGRTIFVGRNKTWTEDL